MTVRYGPEERYRDRLLWHTPVLLSAELAEGVVRDLAELETDTT